MIPNAPRVGDMQSGEPVPEGLYYLRCDKAEYKPTKEKNEPMAAVQLRIFGPEAAEEHHGRVIFENFMLTGEGTFRTRAFLEHAGKDEDFVLEDTDQLLQLEVAAVVTVEKEQKDPKTGQVYPAKNRVTRFLSIEEAEAVEASV